MKWSGILKSSPSLHTTRILVFYSGCPIRPNLLRLLKEKVSGFNFLLRSEMLTFLSFIWTDWLWPFWYNRYRECIKKLKLCKLSESKQRALARLMFGIWHILPSKLLYLFILSSYISSSYGNARLTTKITLNLWWMADYLTTNKSVYLTNPWRFHHD